MEENHHPGITRQNTSSSWTLSSVKKNKQQPSIIRCSHHLAWFLSSYLGTNANWFTHSHYQWPKTKTSRSTLDDPNACWQDEEHWSKPRSITRSYCCALNCFSTQRVLMTSALETNKKLKVCVEHLNRDNNLARLHSEKEQDSIGAKKKERALWHIRMHTTEAGAPAMW